jgi:dienelactone hydrolase
MGTTTDTGSESLVRVPAAHVSLEGNLVIPPEAKGVVLFAHGSGSSRHSPRNRFVAGALREAGLATLLIDLLTEEEEAIDAQTAHLRFDVEMLAVRLRAAAEWLAHNPPTADLPLGFFGASTGAAAALIAAAAGAHRVSAVVSRGGRPDLAGPALQRVWAPTLLVVGGEDGVVIDLNRQAYAQLATPEKRLEVIPGAGHLFEEPGALPRVAELAAEWFTGHLAPPQEH